MKVKDLQVDGEGIFSIMDKGHEFPYWYNPIMVDIAFNGLYGEREVSPFVRNIMGDEITYDKMLILTQVLLEMFDDKWHNVYTLLLNDVPKESYNIKTRETIDDEGKIISNSENKTINDDVDEVSGYNSPDMVDDRTTNRTTSDSGKHDTDNTNKRVRELETSGNLTNAYDDKRKLANYLLKELRYDIIYIDVSQIVGSLYL